MESIKLKGRVGPDGVLKLEVPVGFLTNRKVEVLVILQPILPAPTVSNGHAKTNLTPEELGWPPGFLEQTQGSLADDPIERPPQGEFVVRQEVLGLRTNLN